MYGLYPSLARASYQISKFENFQSTPYLDDAGIPTIGYGTTYYPNGMSVKLTDKPCNSLVAENWLQFQLKEDADHLWKVLGSAPNENQWAALLSITYNEGWPKICGSTLIKDYNAGDLISSSNQFLVWDKLHQNGVLVESVGLLKRRNAERTLFLKPA